MTCHSAGTAARAGIIAGVWIDTHCHLDAAEFDADRDAVVARARAAGVAPDRACRRSPSPTSSAVRELAHRHRLAYALGIHPMCTDAAGDADLARLRDALARARAAIRGWSRSARSASTTSSPASTASARRGSSRPSSSSPREFGLPVLLHVRRAVDSVLKHLRRSRVRRRHRPRLQRQRAAGGAVRRARLSSSASAAR